MEIRDVLHELGGYSVLLEMQSNPGLQALGKRLSDLADVVAKEAQTPRCWCLGDNGKSLCVQMPPCWCYVPIATRPDAPAPEAKSLDEKWAKSRAWAEQRIQANPAPTPEAMLIKELAGWWRANSHKEHDRGTLAALCRLAQRAYDLVKS